MDHPGVTARRQHLRLNQRVVHSNKRPLNAAERTHWEWKASATLARYVDRGVPEPAAIKAGIRDLEQRGMIEFPEGQTMVAWLRRRLEELQAARERVGKAVPSPASGLEGGRAALPATPS